MDDLYLFLIKGDVELHRALHPVQIVVEAGARVHEQRRGHPGEMQIPGKIALEAVLDGFDGDLGINDAQEGTIALGQQQGVLHTVVSPSSQSVWYKQYLLF